MSPVKSFLARVALIAAFLLPATARATDFTDLWWVPQESGWGANVVQSATFMFVTFFIYGADHSPTWYSAELTWDGTRYSGNLYLTQGSFWASPWNPADHPDAQSVGTGSFTPSSVDAYHATLAYTVPGVGSFSKSIEREPLTQIALGGNYLGAQAGGYSGCNSASANGPYSDNYSLAVSQTTTSATLTFTYASGATCTISGATLQYGQLFDMPSASYACTGNLNYTTIATLYEVKATAQGLEGRLAANLPNGCREDANFAGVLY
ncbi:MAG TPA: hypothetical protein VGV08_06130 [Casimicrobiaceae bacterium]|nr:hypothetical protein [Casimicrobiaceae bacterium]